MDAAFKAEIIENPRDISSRLAYADWLEDSGQSNKAELLRILCTLTYGHGGAPADRNALVERARELWPQAGIDITSRTPGRFQVHTEIGPEGLDITIDGGQPNGRHSHPLADMERLIRENASFLPINKITVCNQNLLRTGLCDAFKIGGYARNFVLDNVVLAKIYLASPPVFNQTNATESITLNNAFSFDEESPELCPYPPERLRPHLSNFIFTCHNVRHLRLTSDKLAKAILSESEMRPLEELQTLQLNSTATNKMLEVAADTDRFPNLRQVIHRRNGQLQTVDMDEFRARMATPRVLAATAGEYYAQHSDEFKNQLAQGLGIPVENLGDDCFADVMQRVIQQASQAIQQRKRETKEGPSSLSGLILRHLAGLPYDSDMARYALITEARGKQSFRADKASDLITTLESGAHYDRDPGRKMTADEVRIAGEAIASLLPSVVTALQQQEKPSDECSVTSQKQKAGKEDTVELV